MWFVPFGQEPTPEQQEEMRQAQETQELQVRDFQHGFGRMIEELSQDHLATLDTMLHIIVNNTGHPLPASWQGAVRHAKQTRFGICMFCGVNHDEELREQMEKDARGAADLTVPLDMNRLHSIIRDNIFVDDSGVEVLEGQQPPAESVGDEPIPETITPDTWTDKERELMKQYHLDDVYEELDDDGGIRFLHLKCTGIVGSNGPCGVTYPSLADRMLKGPEDCSGCFQRIAHG